MVYPLGCVEKELARRLKEQGQLIDYGDALEIKGAGLWVTFSPGHDPYVRARFWRVVDGEVVPVGLGEVVETFLGKASR
jgi:hypothetical protein